MTKTKTNGGEETSLAVAGNSAEALISQAIQKGVDVGVMERLLAMRTQLKQESAKEAYDSAMSLFQADCPTIQKTKKVLNKDKIVRYAYAPLEDIVTQVKKFIQAHGFSYTIDTLVEDGWVTAICKTTHEFGHSETSSFKVPIDKEGYMSAPQKFASALTFAKRYAVCNAFGILTGDEDDDTQALIAEEKKTTIFEKAKEMIGTANLASLMDYKAKISVSKKYIDQEKAELFKLIDKREIQIEAEKEPKKEFKWSKK